MNGVVGACARLHVMGVVDYEPDNVLIGVMMFNRTISNKLKIVEWMHALEVSKFLLILEFMNIL